VMSQGIEPSHRTFRTGGGTRLYAPPAGWSQTDSIKVLETLSVIRIQRSSFSEVSDRSASFSKP
jgi:hypothetical protein